MVGEGAGEAGSRSGRPGESPAPPRRTRRGIAGSVVATGRGDDGTTGLLYTGRRIRKDDVRAEAYGTVDEAVAALGTARAELLAPPSSNTLPAPSTAKLADLADLILRLQRELFVVGAELATDPVARERLHDGVTRVSESMVRGLEQVLGEHEGLIAMPREFVVPGETRASAAIEVARTIVRRAERRAITLRYGGSPATRSEAGGRDGRDTAREEATGGDWSIAYLNRLSDLLWVVARAAEQAERHTATPARTRRRAIGEANRTAP